MKKYIITTLSIALLSVCLFSCNDNLDINQNPNQATGAVVTPDLMLASIYANLASDINEYNKYGSLMAGYMFPGDGISGFSDLYSYNFTSSSYNTNWNDCFAHLRDIQAVIETAEADEKYAYFGAAAHVARAYTYQLLVDEYGDVPYTEGVRGGENISPAYDDDAEVYKSLINELDVAIAGFKSADADPNALKFTSVTDPVFGGNTTKWIQFSNNLKLRLLVRAAGTEIDGTVQAAFSSFSSEGFLKENAGINPGYNASNRQNPFYTDYHSNTAGSRATYASYYLPTTYLMTFYLTTVLSGDTAENAFEYLEGKLIDDRRGALLYRDYPETPNFQLGNETAGRPKTPQYVWLESVLKGRDQDFVAFYAFELYFLLAEAAATGHELDGDWKSNYLKGIEESFRYLETNISGSLVQGAKPEDDVEEYIANNENSPLVNPEKATTKEQILEAIITQMYIASNVINGHEAWSNFRRTAYPKIDNVGRLPNRTFVSYMTASPRPDQLSIRLLYPQTAERDINPNTPDAGNSYSTPIFWDKND
ncbi:MAG: SusD/RagB family nutrient-binding outer membrane lipoprotein [Tannerella sp.]|nr:SusD/RagB family nutrient-binding outer membrane lipoprotein [Tannerella sp.]